MVGKRVGHSGVRELLTGVEQGRVGKLVAAMRPTQHNANRVASVGFLVRRFSFRACL